MTTDTAPLAIRVLVLDYLLGSSEFSDHLDVCVGEGNPIPAEWLDAAAMEAYVAATEALDEWMRTLIAGRPYDTPLVEWEHRELVDIDDAKEIAANQGHRYG
ncbi:hypothetical protein LCGC14_1227110 [marine sediment metagenome]|uniref:Uncharacterized protein n=1 Tax=marine sediment metagenome TaxID=412755 RepID=A0A0F9LDM7_9ZZZZ